MTAPQVCRVACRAFVTLTARWLPMTEIRRGLTEIQLSHNTVGSMTAINVKTHGATGDGMSDDYAAVMAAIQEAVDGGGRTVFFPPATTHCRDRSATERRASPSSVFSATVSAPPG